MRQTMSKLNIEIPQPLPACQEELGSIRREFHWERLEALARNVISSISKRRSSVIALLHIPRHLMCHLTTATYHRQKTRVICPIGTT